MIDVRMPGLVMWSGQMSVLSVPIYRRMGQAEACVRTNVMFDDESSGYGRTYIARLSAEVMRATAAIFRVVAGKIVTTCFFNVGSRPHPVTLCIDVNGAKAWLNGIYERKFDG